MTRGEAAGDRETLRFRTGTPASESSWPWARWRRANVAAAAAVAAGVSANRPNKALMARAEVGQLLCGSGSSSGCGCLKTGRTRF